MKRNFNCEPPLWFLEDIADQLADPLKSISKRVVVNPQLACRFSVVLVRLKEHLKGLYQLGRATTIVFNQRSQHVDAVATDAHRRLRYMGEPEQAKVVVVRHSAGPVSYTHLTLPTN